MLFYLLAIIILAVDQSLKFIVHRSLFFGQSIPLIDNFVKLTYVRNTGAAFSLFMGFSPYLIIVGVAAIAAIIYFHFRSTKKDYYLQIALASILGGSLGNLLDRILRGYVIDYIDIGAFPVFNFADIMINTGVLLIVIRLIKEEKDVSDLI